MRSFERRIKRLEELSGDRPGVVFLDHREPDPGEFPRGTVIIVDDVGSDGDGMEACEE